MKELEELIPAMAGLPGITGHEDIAAAELDALMADFDEKYTDAVGNRVFVRRCGRGNAPRILLDTHFDEIGMMVTEITETGDLRVAAVGGLDVRTLAGAQVRIYGKRTFDAIVSVTLGEEKEELPKVTDLFVRTGFCAEEIGEFVRVGTPIGFLPCYEKAAHGRIVGKGLDNRACAACAAYALAGVPASELAGDVYLLFSVHEETDRVGGVAAGGFAVDPDYAMVIDVNLGRTPHTEKHETVLLGKGPSVTRGAAVDRKLTAMLEAVCRRENIPYQISVAAADTGTNTGALRLVREGIPVADVGLPLRAMHTPVEMIDPADAAALADLVRAFVTDGEIAEVFG